MVLTGVCLLGRQGQASVCGRPNHHDYSVGSLLLELIADCKCLLPAGFIFQQDGAPAHMASVAQDWLQANCPGFTEKNQWPVNSTDLDPLDYHIWGAMPVKYYKLQLKPKMIHELRVALQTIWEVLPRDTIVKCNRGSFFDLPCICVGIKQLS